VASINVGSVAVDVVPSVRQFAARMRAQILPDATRIGRDAGERIQEGIENAVQPVQIRVDLGRALARLRQLTKALEDIDGKHVQARVTIDFGNSAAELLALARILRRLDGQTVRINIRTDADRSISALLRLGNSASSTSGQIGGLHRRILGLPLPALAAGAIGAGAGLVQLAANLAPVIGLTAGIPLAISSAVAALATLMVALKGTGAAFGAALGPDAEKFEESLKGLSPAAQSAARELRALRPQFLAIRTAAQQAFFGPLRGQITAVTRALAGPLKAGIRDVSAQYGLAARDALRFAASARTVSSVRVGFNALEGAIRRMRPALVPFLAGFRDLSIAAVPALTRMAAAAGQVGQRFGEWMSQLAASGRVPELIGAGLDVLKTLGSVLFDLGGIIRSVFTAAQQAGSGLFGMLGPALNQLNAFLKTAAAQQALQAFFVTMNQVGRAIAPIVPILGHLVAAVIQALAPALQAATPLISLLVSQFGLVVRAITPVLAPLGQVAAALLTALLPVLQPVTAELQRLTQQALTQLVTAIIQALPSIQQIGMALISLLPALLQMAPALLQWAVAFAPLIPPLAQLAALLITQMLPYLRILIGVVSLLVQGFVGGLRLLVAVAVPVLNLIIAVLRGVGAVASWLWTAAVGPALRGIGAAAMWLWNNAIKPAFNGIVLAGKILAAVIAVAVVAPILIAFNLLKAAALFLWRNVIGPAFRGIGAAVRAVWSGVIRPALSAFMAFLRGPVATAVRWIYNTIIRPIWTAAGAVVRGVYNGVIRPALAALNSFFRSVIAPVFRWITNTIIRPLWTGAGNAIRAVWTGVIRPAFNALRSALTTVRNAFSTAVSGIRRIWDGLRDATRKPVAFVINTVYNNGIRKAWNLIAGLVKLPQLGHIRFAAGGVVPAGAYGVLPGYAPGRDTMLAAVSPGEGWIRPDATRAVGSGFITGLNAAAARGGVSGAARWLSQLGGPAFQGGGIVGKIRDAVSGAKNLAIRGASNRLARGASFAAKRILDPILAQVNRMAGDSNWVKAMAALPRRMITGFIDWVKKNIDPKLGGDAAGVVKAAARYIGVGDDRGMDNNNIFTRQWGWPAGTPWCALFVSTAIRDAKAQKHYPGYPSAAVASYNAAMQHVPISAGRPGDLATYRGNGHINIIEAKAGGGYRTIGGNEGPRVQRSTRGGQTAVLRPRFATGGIVGGVARRVFGHEWRYAADPADRRDPLTHLYAGLALNRFDSGGWLPTGPSLVFNGTGRPEPVLTTEQFTALTSRDRTISVMEGATIILRDEVDIDTLNQRTEFAVRSASFG
jgi:hypothetical protein